MERKKGTPLGICLKLKPPTYGTHKAAQRERERERGELSQPQFSEMR